jgi:predicted RNA-binding protein with RPS1 domain
MSENSAEYPTSVVIGEIYDGKVIKIKPFGAIISLPGNVLGLVHISQIASGFIQSVDDILAVGDEVLVRVLSIESATGKISLSMKDVPQLTNYDDEDDYVYDAPVVISPAQAASFEEKLKSWQKLSSDRIAGINRRNKRRK